MGVVIEGDIGRLKSALKQLSETDIKKLNSAIGELLRSSTVERFNTGKNPDDKPWPVSKNAIASGKKTLLNTARLRNSINSSANQKGVAVGTNTIYAATHQFGDSREIKAKTQKGMVFMTPNGFRRKKYVRITIPARPFLGISEDDMTEIKETVLDVIREATE